MSTIALFALLVISSCGSGDESLAKKAGSGIGGTLTDFASGVGKGIDKQLTVSVELGPELKKRGVATTLAKWASEKSIAVYLISPQPLKASIIAKAFNKEKQEIGRSIVEVQFEADDAKYITFPFPHETDTQLVARYVVELRRQAK